MHNQTQKLTPREHQLLAHLARGKSYREIRETMEVNSSTLHVHLWKLRKKTGIDTQDRAQCQKALADNQQIRHAQPLYPTSRELAPTPHQIEAMRLRAQRKAFCEIGDALHIRTQTAQNLVSVGCRRAGITVHGFARFAALREYLDTHHPQQITVDDL